MTKKSFLTDIKTLRERARKHIEQGAVTAGYRGDRDTVVDLLNHALATEIICVLRYKRHYYTATGINAQSVAAEFLQHATEEQIHADQIAQRESALEIVNFDLNLFDASVGERFQGGVRELLAGFDDDVALGVSNVS